jgi:hypothetical protein
VSERTQGWQDFEGVWHHCHCPGAAGQSRLNVTNAVRTGQIAGLRVKAMEIVVVLLFFVLLAVASAAGLTADSRDSADWKPTDDGVRAVGWH